MTFILTLVLKYEGKARNDLHFSLFFVNKADEKNKSDSGTSRFNSLAMAHKPTASSEKKKSIK